MINKDVSEAVKTTEHLAAEVEVNAAKGQVAAIYNIFKLWKMSNKHATSGDILKKLDEAIASVEKEVANSVVKAEAVNGFRTLQTLISKTTQQDLANKKKAQEKRDRKAGAR